MASLSSLHSNVDHQGTLADLNTLLSTAQPISANQTQVFYERVTERLPQLPDLSVDGLKTLQRSVFRLAKPANQDKATQVAFKDFLVLVQSKTKELAIRPVTVASSVPIDSLEKDLALAIHEPALLRVISDLVQHFYADTKTRSRSLSKKEVFQKIQFIMSAINDVVGNTKLNSQQLENFSLRICKIIALEQFKLLRHRLNAEFKKFKEAKASFESLQPTISSSLGSVGNYVMDSLFEGMVEDISTFEDESFKGTHSEEKAEKVEKEAQQKPKANDAVTEKLCQGSEVLFDFCENMLSQDKKLVKTFPFRKMLAVLDAEETIFRLSNELLKVSNEIRVLNGQLGRSFSGFYVQSVIFAETVPPYRLRQKEACYKFLARCFYPNRRTVVAFANSKVGFNRYMSRAKESLVLWDQSIKRLGFQHFIDQLKQHWLEYMQELEVQETPTKQKKKPSNAKVQKVTSKAAPKKSLEEEKLDPAAAASQVLSQAPLRVKSSPEPGKVFPFKMASRVDRWHQYDVFDSDVFDGYTAVIFPSQKRYHGFSLLVDRFYDIGFKRSWQNEKTEATDQRFIVPAEFKYGSKVERGAIIYCVDPDGVCYHRYFHRNLSDEVLVQKCVSDSFEAHDFPNLSLSAQDVHKKYKPRKLTLQNQDQDQVSKDPLFGTVTVLQADGLVIRLIPSKLDLLADIQ